MNRTTAQLKRVALASLLVVLAFGSPWARLAGQAPRKPQQPIFRSDAHFVLVDAYPLRDGTVVEGLAAADFEVREALDHLNDLVDVLGHLREGRTSVILVTEGWRLAPEDRKLLAEIDRTQHNVPPAPVAAGSRIRMGDSVTEGGRASCMRMTRGLVQFDGGQRLRELIVRASQRNISFIPVNPAGLVVSDSAPSEDVRPVNPVTSSVLSDSFDRVNSREDGLRTLAANTDGTSVLGNNDLRAGLRKVTAELRSFYLLGYYSSNRVFDGKPRRITVKAKEYEVRARRGYIAPTEAERTARANPVKAAGPSAVEMALDVLSGIRSADDRTFNVGRYLRADAAPVLGVPAVFRATPSPRSPLVAVTAPAFTRNERIHIEWPVMQALGERTARILGRNGAPLAVAVTLTQRNGSAGPLVVANATLGSLAAGDYVVELRVTAAGSSRTALVAFRVVP